MGTAGMTRRFAQKGDATYYRKSNLWDVNATNTFHENVIEHVRRSLFKL